jgi:putative oxidoreductase
VQNPFSLFFKRFPFLSADQSLILLRIVTAGLFMAHAIVRVANGTITRFAQFMETLGFPHGAIWVWGITIVEIVAGVLIIAGLRVRWAALALFCVAAGGIVVIHRDAGWFVGEHGTGGSEYSVALICALLVIAAADRERSGG